MNDPIPGTDAALVFRDVRTEAAEGNLTRLPLNLMVRAGDLTLVGVSDPQQAATIADVAGGLIPAESGTVTVLGHDWDRLGHDAVDRLRGRIGRLLTRGRWLESVPILENVLLPQLHHTERSREDLLREATASARRFGLPGIPTTDYHDTMPADLQRAGCVGAFLGAPALVLLEEPAVDARADMLSPLVNATLDAMHRGAAVLWLTHRLELVHDPKIPATRRFVASAVELTPVAA